MSKSIYWVGMAVAFGVSGCAIHPLPQDYAGFPAHLIVRKIRCEAQTALKDNLTQWLDAAAIGDGPGTPGDARLVPILAKIKSGETRLRDVNEKLFPPEYRDVITKFQGSAIAYDFSFDITETNNLDANLNLLKPFHHMFGSAAVTANYDRSRQSVRAFTITDTFSGLFTKIDPALCAGLDTGANYIYPITGRVGIGEMINNFVNLTLFDGLSGKSPATSGPPTVVDTLTFKTTIGGSVAPKLTVSPLGNAFQVADATLTALDSRVDQHILVIGFSLPPPKAPAKAKQPAKEVPRARVGTLVNARGTEAEIEAAHAIEQFITRFQLGRAGVIVLPAQ